MKKILCLLLLLFSFCYCFSENIIGLNFCVDGGKTQGSGEYENVKGNPLSVNLQVDYYKRFENGLSFGILGKFAPFTMIQLSRNDYGELSSYGTGFSIAPIIGYSSIKNNKEFSIFLAPIFVDWYNINKTGYINSDDDIYDMDYRYNCLLYSISVFANFTLLKLTEKIKLGYDIALSLPLNLTIKQQVINNISVDDIETNAKGFVFRFGLRIPIIF